MYTLSAKTVPLDVVDLSENLFLLASVVAGAEGKVNLYIVIAPYWNTKISLKVNTFLAQNNAGMFSYFNVLRMDGFHYDSFISVLNKCHICRKQITLSLHHYVKKFCKLKLCLRPWVSI